MKCEYGALLGSTDMGKPKYLEKDLSQGQFGHHQSRSFLETEARKIGKTRQRQNRLYLIIQPTIKTLQAVEVGYVAPPILNINSTRRRVITLSLGPLYVWEITRNTCST
jgi:hypothetical protein